VLGTERYQHLVTMLRGSLVRGFWEDSGVADSHVYVFLHIPRTGGTTINGHLRQHLVFDDEFVHLGGLGDAYRRDHGLPPFTQRDDDRRGRARVLSGHRVRYGVHDLVPGREPRYITILRDPADRIVSAYNYRMAIGDVEYQEFDAWYEAFPRNHMFKWLRRGLGVETMDEVLAMLRTFWFVGATEHLDEDLPHLFRAIGTPETWHNLRVTPDEGAVVTKSHETHPFGLNVDKRGLRITRRASVTPELRELIHNDNRRDVRLHRFALRRRERMRWG
jgi:hypothetical protein